MVTKSASREKNAFSATLKSARFGLIEAQYEVGLMYANGVGVRPNIEQALEWIRRAAERGFAPAQYLLGTRYATGVAVERDEHQAVVWYIRAAEQGISKAYLRLGKFYAKAHPEASLDCFRKAAEQGLAEAQLWVGHAYVHGTVVERDYGLALQWYQSAADQGLPAAQFALAELYAKGAGVSPDIDEAIAWYSMAAKQYWHPAKVALELLEVRESGRSNGAGRRRRKSGSPDRPDALEMWESVAEQGDADLKYHMGLMYELGLGIPQDVLRARKWYFLAAKQEDARAILALAKIAENNGDGEAADWYLKAAKLGSTEAQFSLGRLYSTAQSEQQDAFQGLAWYFRAAQGQDAKALLTLGYLLSGDLVPLAVASFQRAAEEGVAAAQYALAQHYSAGSGVSKNIPQAFAWYLKAAEQGHVQAQSALGVMCLGNSGMPKDMRQALTWLQKAAENGDPAAQWNLGMLCLHGVAGVEKDLRQAFVWCQKSANLDFAPAQAALGVLFARMEKMDEAARWLKKAAKHGDSEAQYNLAVMYMNPRGRVAADLAQGFYWFLKAAEQGVPNAQGRLGLMYATGEGVALDPIEAHKWLLLAAQGGDESGQANFVHSESRLGLMQITEARRRADAWKQSRNPVKHN